MTNGHKGLINDCKRMGILVMLACMCFWGRFCYAGSSTQLSVGNPAPAFSLPDAEGAPTSLKRFKGKWVLLYFYPRDFTA